MRTASFKPPFLSQQALQQDLNSFGEYRKSYCVFEHKQIAGKYCENLVARYISVDIDRLITIFWRLSLAVASAWRIRSIYSRRRSL
jgi:hypothetical protein